MALQRDTLYPGRFTTATTAHPQGLFKNRTTSTSQDGSYLEKDWLNDWDGFFGSLLSKAGLTPDGNVDAVGASQYFNALQTVTVGNYVTAGGTANVITLADTSVTSYVDGMSLRFKVSLANTGATTLNVNGVGAQTVYGSAGLACQGGELAPGLATVVYSTALSGFVIVHCTGGNKQVPNATQSGHAVNKSQFDAVLSANGYQKLPSGLLIQWQLVNHTTAGTQQFTYPIAFPNTSFFVIATDQTAANPALTVGVAPLSSTTLTVTVTDAAGVAATGGAVMVFSVGY